MAMGRKDMLERRGRLAGWRDDRTQDWKGKGCVTVRAVGTHKAGLWGIFLVVIRGNVVFYVSLNVKLFETPYLLLYFHISFI